MTDEIVVTVWKEHDEYVASADDLLLHAFGATEEEARANLLDQCRDQLVFLGALGQDRLAPHLKATLPLLRAFVGTQP